MQCACLGRISVQSTATQGSGNQPVRDHDRDYTVARCRADARARQRGEYSQKVHATRDLEQELSMEFPHGLPVS